MAERRPLIDALKAKPERLRPAEKEFLHGENAKPAAVPELVEIRTTPPVNRVPFTTRIRDDLAKALKRASLERQLKGVEPNTVQDILESALEPWLRANGHLT
jgi:hypothetical protein